MLLCYTYKHWVSKYNNVYISKYISYRNKLTLHAMPQSAFRFFVFFCVFFFGINAVPTKQILNNCIIIFAIFTYKQLSVYAYRLRYVFVICISNSKSACFCFASFLTDKSIAVIIYIYYIIYMFVKFCFFK